MIDYNNMTISEKLICFVDGELLPEETGDLFFELAKNPEYQEELRQLVMMKNTFKNSIVAAPPALKSDVLKKTIYRDSPFVKLANAVALLIGFILSRNSLTYAGIGFLAITSLFLLKDFTDNNQKIQTLNNQKVVRSIPEVNSKELVVANQIGSDNTTENLKDAKIADYAINTNKKSERLNTKLDENQVLSNLNDNSSKDLSDKKINLILPSDYEIVDNFNLNLIGKEPSKIYYSEGFSRFLNKLSFSLKKFDGNSTPNFNLGNASESMFNNISLGINYNIDYNNSVGLLLGFENFLMDFEKYEGDILFNYRQSYNTQWLGLQYSYNMNPMGESGIRPNLNIIAGATNIGPIVKLGAGVTYYFSDFFSISGGIESGWLFYSNNGGLDNNKWFNTHKLGYNLGFNLGL